MKTLPFEVCFSACAIQCSERDRAAGRDQEDRKVFNTGSRPCVHSLFASMALAALGGCAKEAASLTVRIDGSSTVFPISDAIAAQFQKQEPVRVDIKVPVGISGTTGGFRKFCIGETDVSDASRAINSGEAELCAKHGIEYIELPIAYDGLTVLVNPKNTWAGHITTAELKKTWEPEAHGQIMKWSQVRKGWPDRDLHLYGAGFDSGTYDYFTDAIVGKARSSRTDFTSSEDDEVLVQDVARDDLALGFFGYAYFRRNQEILKALAVDDGNPDNGDGPIAPSVETVRDGTYEPLARPLFIYVSAAALKRREVELFVSFYLTKCSTYVARVGYIPLPDSAYRWVHERVRARRTGSLFADNGSHVGTTIDQLVQREESAPK